MRDQSRHVVWFSCGAASAVAARLSVKLWSNVEVVYCNTMRDEHPDNQRFFNEVEEWIGTEITVIESDTYKSVVDVWDARKYMAGISGAPCTTEMKKLPRYEFQEEDDIHTFGYTFDEQSRVERFEDNNPELNLRWILVERGISKDDCYDIVTNAGIALPVMYQLGYKNNNCIGCVKATSAKYWNMIRRDFPEVFDARAKQSVEIGARLTRLKGERIFISELPVDYMPADSDIELPDISCGPVCITEDGEDYE